MIEDENITSETEEENTSLPEEITPAEPFLAEATEDEKEPTEESAPAAKPYRTGTVVAAFIFFAITLTVFIFYEVFAISFLYVPFANGIDNIGEAIAAIFGYTFGLAITLAFGVAQLPENIISIILFNRIRRRATTKGKRITYTVFFALSIVMLLVMLLTIGGFFAIIGANN